MPSKNWVKLDFLCIFKMVVTKMKTLIDRMKTYTYNKGTVWFLSTPIQIHRRICGAALIGRSFFCLHVTFRPFHSFIVVGNEASA